MVKTKFKKFLHLLLAWFSYWRYGRPARKLIVIGVTGTKGKSTTCRMIASVLEAGGFKVGMLTTVEFQIADKRWMNDRKMTMLGRGEIQKMLKQMVVAGCEYAVIETSSEGILQYRHYGLDYDIAVFTNLGTEHSERHGGLENLKNDKGRLFAELKKRGNKILRGDKISKIIIANLDDEHAAYYLSFDSDEKIGFGLSSHELRSLNYELCARVIQTDLNGSVFMVHDWPADEAGSRFIIHLVGAFNVYNALPAIAVGKAIGIPEEKIVAGLLSVKQVPGRMEFIEEGQNFKVVVDYAHEPMSLTELFKTLRSLVGSHKVIGVVGSDGGGRDQSKRGKMGEIAGQLCDYVVITDVNCFDEDPALIAEMLAAGARQAGKKDNENLFIEVDRRKAIEKAIALGREGDAIAITAKGTEPCIVVGGGRKIPWDDRQVARESIKHLNTPPAGGNT